MLRPSPNHGTLRLPNDDDDDTLSTCQAFSSRKLPRSNNCLKSVKKKKMRLASSRWAMCIEINMTEGIWLFNLGYFNLMELPLK